MVSFILPSPPPPSVWGIAFPHTILATGTVLRCDIFVDTIQKIEIITTTKEVLLEEVRELEVGAFDGEGRHLCISQALACFRVTHDMGVIIFMSKTMSQLNCI